VQKFSLKKVGSSTFGKPGIRNEKCNTIFGFAVFGASPNLSSI